MKVTCELEIGNNQTHPDTKIIFEGDPMQKSGFVNIRIGDNTYEVRPADITAALHRVRSDG